MRTLAKHEATQVAGGSFELEMAMAKTPEEPPSPPAPPTGPPQGTHNVMIGVRG